MIVSHRFTEIFSAVLDVQVLDDETTPDACNLRLLQDNVHMTLGISRPQAMVIHQRLAEWLGLPVIGTVQAIQVRAAAEARTPIRIPPAIPPPKRRRRRKHHNSK